MIPSGYVSTLIVRATLDVGIALAPRMRRQNSFVGQTLTHMSFDWWVILCRFWEIDSRFPLYQSVSAAQ